jgi:hypothetical protein
MIGRIPLQSLDTLEREAADIAQAIEAYKQRPYQASEKALVSDYIRATGDFPRAWEVTPESLNLPYPVWHLIRSAYLDKAINWSRQRNAVA